MSRFLTGFGAAVLVAGVAWFFSGAAPTDAQQKVTPIAPPRVAWEYKVVTDQPNEAEFNKLGADGWELVTSYWRGTPGPSVHTFKRRK